MKNILIKSNNKGFTLIELMLSLYIIMITLSLMIAFMPLLKRIVSNSINVQDYLSVKQLRYYIALNEVIEVNKNNMILKNHDKELYIVFEKERIVIKKGYQIIMQNVKNAYFYQNDDGYYLCYEKDRKYQVYLGK